MYTIGITKTTNLLDEIFIPSSSRSNPYLYQLIGLSSESSYNDTLALFHHKLSEPGKGIIFGDSIPKPRDRALIDTILQELLKMRIGNYVNEDINLTTSETLNIKLRQALDEVIALAISKERFSNETIRNNFIAKLMIWCNLYTDELNFEHEDIPKCLFYGPIKRHEVYFLMILGHIGMDVIYFNPTHDGTFDAIDENGSFQKTVLGSTSPVLTPYEERVSKGVVVEKVTTYAKKATHELEQTLYNETGIYKPWQFSDGTTHPIIMDSVIEDTLTYWNEPTKLRPGFKTLGKTVYTPAFFMKVNGVYQNINEYYELIEKLKAAKNYILYETPHFTYMNFGQLNQKDLYSLAFCLNPNQTIKREAIKQHILYQKMLTMRADFQEFILSKLEETFSNSNLSFFNFSITDKERVRLMAALFTAEDQLLNLIESYDFTADVPKVIFYINSRDTFNQDDAMMLGLLHAIGIDVLLLVPNGANNIELVISDKFINQIKLDEFVYDLPLKAPAKKGSFFSKLFR